MARSMTTVAVSRVNRRLLLLAIILAILSAVFIYMALSRSGGEEAPVGDLSVVVATQSIPAGTQITQDMVEVRLLPETAVGAQPFTDVEDVVGQVAHFPIAPGEPILLSKVVGATGAVRDDVLSFLLEGGQRAMAIRVEAVVGAGGLVLPGDHVDVFWVPNQPERDVVGAQLVAENVEVVAVQQTLVDLPPTAPGVTEEGDGAAAGDGTVTRERVRGSEAEPIPDATTVTLMLTPDQAQRVFCAEMTGSLRLLVRAFGDDSPSGLPVATCTIPGTEEAEAEQVVTP